MPLLSVIAATMLTLRPPAPLPGEAVIARAYAMYKGKWFHSVTYVQRTLLPLERRVETWYVTLQPPGMLRVDVAPEVTGRALIYRGDSVYEFGRGQLRSAGIGVEPLEVLLHDLHSQPPERTIATLKRYGFDLSRTHETTLDGAPVIVVGALAGDTVSNQFWLDRQHLLLVRLIERNGSDPRRPLDARVGNYFPAGKGWLERQVRIALGTDVSTIEQYSDVKIDPPLEADVFTPLPFHRPRWVGTMPDSFGHVPNQIPTPGIH